MFSYPRYGSQILAPIYKYLPDVTKIRAAVANAFKVDPKLEDTRSALADENGSIWVLDGAGCARPTGSSATRILRSERVRADHEADTTGVNGTRIVAHNGPRRTSSRRSSS